MKVGVAGYELDPAAADVAAPEEPPPGKDVAVEPPVGVPNGPVGVPVGNEKLGCGVGGGPQGGLTGPLIGGETGRLIGGLTGRLIGRLIGLLIGRLIGLLMGLLIGRLIGLLMGRLIGLLIGRLIGGLNGLPLEPGDDEGQAPAAAWPLANRCPAVERAAE